MSLSHSLHQHEIKRIVTCHLVGVMTRKIGDLRNKLTLFEFTVSVSSNPARQLVWVGIISQAQHEPLGATTPVEEETRVHKNSCVKKFETARATPSKIRQQYEDLIVTVVNAIRARVYAYNTEHIYGQWVCRYINYCNGVSPKDAGSGNVVEFLNELVVSGNVRHT